MSRIESAAHRIEPAGSLDAAIAAPPEPAEIHPPEAAPLRLSLLRELEAESIHIIREAFAEFAKPVMLYSIGKDSQALVHLVRKAFHPVPVPFPLLHVDTTWKFREMYAFRDRYVREQGLHLIVHKNQRALDQGMNPFDHSSQKYTFALKTRALLDALAEGGFDAAFGGARRDEEKSRAKERVYSVRDRQGQWDPRNQRPELWNLYNGRIEKGENVRIFPLSNWSELDVWRYVQLEGIPVVPLYFAAERPVVDRHGTLIAVDDARFRLLPGEVPRCERVRFRTLGCYPLSGALRSSAGTVAEIIEEMEQSHHSERQGRVIDHDEEGSMETKKREGYF